MRLRLQVLVFVSALLGGWCCAQQPGPALEGMVRTPSGTPIAGATLQLKCPARSAEAVSDAAGRFRFEALPAAACRLTVRANGRTAQYAQPIDLGAQAADVAIAFSDRGEITLAALQQQARGGEALSSQAVSELPLNKRDFSQLLLLAAGTMTDANGGTNFTQQFAINGQRGVEATFAMDGADISDPEMGGSTFSNFNVDAVEAIHSSSGWMPAEIGRGAAGFTNIQTRSGATGFHGSFFEFLRNSALDARNYFDHPTPAYPGRIPPFRRNEFGFTNGGSVLLPHVYDGRKRTFYFTEYQGFRQVLGTTQVIPVPTAAERSGIDHIKYSDGSTDTLTVPVDPGIAAVLARYPMPNLPTGAFGARTYATASKVVTNADQFSLRIDHAITSRDQFMARFSLDNITGPTTNPAQTAIDPKFAVVFFDRQRNVVATWTRTSSPHLIFESSIGIIRSTPGFPTPDHTDPGLKFGDNLYENFNNPAGSVMQSYGNLFQGRENVTYTRARHTFKMGAEVRLNRDTTYYGSSPNGEYLFGGGKAYATTHIASASGKHDVNPGDPLPDTLSGFLAGDPFVYNVGLAPAGVSGGEHAGPAAINRNNVSAYAQDTWKITPRLTLDYGLRWDLYTPFVERANRTAAFRVIDGKQQFVVNPQPGFRTDWHAFQPRIQVSAQITPNLQFHIGGSLMNVQPNIWQDNFLTGTTPFIVYPRAVSSASNPLTYAFTITPSQLPVAYTLSGEVIPVTSPKRLRPNTIMDVDRYQKELAAITHSGKTISALNLNGIDPNFGSASLYTWTAGFERKIASVTADLAYVGDAAVHLPHWGFPNAYAGASPGFAPHTEFDSAENIVGGFGVENVVNNRSHSTYHALQASLSGTVPHGGPGIQAGYTWSKSIDNDSSFGQFSQNPFDTHPEKGPSSFDVTHSLGVSVAQDLHLQQASALHAVPRAITGGWEMLSISSISSGAPFTVYSGIQQTGYGSNNADRPDQIAKPKLSTARKVREDYFGRGGDNGGAFFSVPIHVAGGTGPNQGRFGTLGRNTFRGPAFYNFDFAFIKDTPIGRRKSGAERVDVQFRSEFFNLFNIVNMGLPSDVLQVDAGSGSILRDTGFGIINKTAGTSRQIQFSLKLIY